jgi:hypothetical protein
MYVGIRSQKREDGRQVPYLLLMDSYRPEGGQSRKRTLYLGAADAPDIESRARKRLRLAGYTPAQIRAILEALCARVERNEHVPITVQGKLVAWRDNRKKK